MRYTLHLIGIVCGVNDSHVEYCLPSEHNLTTAMEIGMKTSTKNAELFSEVMKQKGQPQEQYSSSLGLEADTANPAMHVLWKIQSSPYKMQIQSC